MMEDPVIAADGYTYERQAIVKWHLVQDKSPMTGWPMPMPIQLMSNQVQKEEINKLLGKEVVK